MSLPIRLSLCLGALPLFVAVGPLRERPPAPSSQLSLSTDQTTYEAAPTMDEPPYFYTFTLVARLENRMARTLEVKRSCPSTYPEPMPLYTVPAVEEGLDSGYSPVQICSGYIPTPVIIVQPGATRVDTLQITGPHVWSGRTNQPQGTLSGRFRLAYELHPCVKLSQCDELRSNEFEVHLRR
jgi:hypothetical protein